MFYLSMNTPLWIEQKIKLVLKRKHAVSRPLAITFTNKAAKEMKDRIHLLIGDISKSLQVSTFHSFGLKILRENYKYDGLVITDSFEMAAITKYYTNQEVALGAIDAGVDILLMPENYKEAFDTIIQAINTNQIKEERINESVKRILKLKTKYKLLEPYSIIFSSDFYFKKDE